MAKKKTVAKATPEVEVAQPEVKATNKVEQVIIEKKPKNTNNWDIKDRMYYLKNGKSPLTYLIRGSNIFWFDEEKGYERELKYTSNQRTPFVDEMVGEQRLEHIIFTNGSLFVPKNKTVLQKLLSLYHPQRNTLFEEYKPEVIAEDQVSVLELEVDALLAARELDIDTAEAVMRVEIGSRVAKMSSKELRRDLLIFAKQNPSLFLDLVNDDNVVLRNFGIRSVEEGILSLSSDQRYFSWASTQRKLFTVPFDEHPYTALAHWFKTDEGMEIYSNIEKRLNA